MQENNNTIELPGVLWLPSPHQRARHVNNNIDTIQLFALNSCRTREDVVALYSSPEFAVSAHFTVDCDGTLLQHLPADQCGYHLAVSFDLRNNKTEMTYANDTAIGIGLLRAQHPSVPFTAAQYGSVRVLLSYLTSKFTITQITRKLPRQPDDIDNFPFDWAQIEKTNDNKNYSVISNNSSDNKLTNTDSTNTTTTLTAATASVTPSMLSRDVDVHQSGMFVYMISSPNCDDRPTDTVIDTIVLHHTVASFDGTIAIFTSAQSQVSAHFLLDRDGTAVQHVSINQRAWHAGVSVDKYGRERVNAFSIGIELVNKGDGVQPYPEAQLQQLLRLLKFLTLRYPIKQITSHAFIARPKGRKIDPLGFPWQRLLPDFENMIAIE